MNCGRCQATNALTALRCFRCGAALKRDTLGETRALVAEATPPPTPQFLETQVLDLSPGLLATGPDLSETLPSGEPTDPQSASFGGSGDLKPGSLLGGRYKIIRALGEGGMGAVYQAWDGEVDRVVAIKVIRPELADSPQILRRFKQELILARQTTHRNVVRIYDLVVADGIKFISMEFIDGRDLSSLLDEKFRLAPDEAANIMIQVCRGLSAAHAAGIVHRDLKPQNIMVEAQGRAAVMDFGIAHLMRENAFVGAASMADGANSTSNALTQFGQLLGTPQYMSPEQAKCEAVDGRSDIFAMGIIFYEMLTGKRPFGGDTLQETIRLRVEDVARPPIEIVPELPRALNAVVVKCLKIDPAQRYQSADELAHDLELFLGLIQPAANLKPWRWVVSGLVAVLLIGSLAFWLQVLKQPARAMAPVKILIADFQNRTGDRVFDGTLEPVLNVALEEASFITSYNRGQAHKLAAQLRNGATVLDEAAARLIARREGLGIVVLGSIESAGSGYRISARAIDPISAKLVGSRNVKVNSGSEVLHAVGKLAVDIRKTLGDASPRSAQVAAAETFSSGSLEAAQKYALAQDEQWRGKWEDAIRDYKQVVAMDPNFGRAYAGIAANLANLGRRSEAEQFYQLAMRHVDRMSEREKFRTRGGYYLLMRNYPQATRQFRELTNLYPSDSAGIANLALSQFYGRNMAGALEDGRRAVALLPDNLLQRNNVGLYAMYAGDFETAIKESEAILKVNPSFEKALLCLALSRLGQDRPSDAEAMYQKLASLSEWGTSEAAAGLADLAFYEGRLSLATSLLENGIQTDRAHNNGPGVQQKEVTLAQIYMQRGQKAKALQLAQAIIASGSNEEALLFPVARIYIDGGAPGKAAAIAQKLAARFEPDPQAYGRLIEGEILLQANHAREALDKFHEARKISDTWMAHFDLGRAYLATGEFPDADAEFDTCLKRRGEATAVFLDDEPSYHYLAVVHYYAGRARQGLKSPGAADEYRAFLTTQETGDANPLVAEAKRRLDSIH